MSRVASFPAPEMSRYGNWTQLYSGRSFWPMDPRPGDFDMGDVSIALSRICRYNGHCLRYYSVAEHSVHLALWVYGQTGSRRLTLQALLHDGPEFIIADIVRPAKPFLQNYGDVEFRIQAALMEQHGLPHDLADIVKEGDTRILVDERAQNMAPTGLQWSSDGLEPLNVTLQFWDPVDAQREFLDLYRLMT